MGRHLRRFAVATALLDRLLHHAVVIQIEGSSYRLREHADLLPETQIVRYLNRTDRVLPTTGATMPFLIDHKVLDRLTGAPGPDES